MNAKHPAAKKTNDAKALRDTGEPDAFFRDPHHIFGKILVGGWVLDPNSHVFSNGSGRSQAVMLGAWWFGLANQSSDLVIFGVLPVTERLSASTI
jgi:hypothetical protein